MVFECAICIGNVILSDASILKCGHVFHRECLENWLDTKAQCPECRGQVDRNGYVRQIFPKVSSEGHTMERIINLEEENKNLKVDVSVCENQLRKLWHENDELKLKVEKSKNLQVEHKQLSMSNKQLLKHLINLPSEMKLLENKYLSLNIVLQDQLTDIRKMLEVHKCLATFNNVNETARDFNHQFSSVLDLVEASSSLIGKSI